MLMLSKVIFAFCVGLFLAMPPATAQTASDPEVKQIMDAAKTYAKRYGGTENYFDFKFIKRVKHHALVKNFPKPQYRNQFEGATIILKKVNGKWVGQDMGTGIGEEWEKKVPEFKPYL